MQLRNLFEMDDERAVSPVIGVILMVAITVILAAVIGTFVLGLGDQVGDTAPNSNFAWDGSDTDNDVTVTHDGGDSIDPDLLEVRGSPVNEEDVCTGAAADAWDTESVSAGDDCTINEGQMDTDGGELRLVWESGDTSSTLSRFNVEDGS